jgi:hypothetical protein
MHKNVSYLNGTYNSGYGGADGYARPGQVNRDMNRDANREQLQRSGHSAVSATGGSSSAAGTRSFGNANSGSNSHSNSQQQQQQLSRQVSTADYGHYTEASFDESQLHLDVTAAAAAALDNSADYSDHDTNNSSSRNAYAHHHHQQQQHEQLRGWNEDPHELQQLEVRNHQLQFDELPHSTAAPHTAAHHANHQHANHHAAQYHTTAAAAAAAVNSPRVRGNSVDSTLDPWLVASPRRVPGGTPKHFHKGATPQNKVYPLYISIMLCCLNQYITSCHVYRKVAI